MEDRYSFKISPANIVGDLIPVTFTSDTIVITAITGNCCFITVINKGVDFKTQTVSYYNMVKALSGGTNGSSLLTGLTIPILFRETAVDIGYYSVFDGAVLQKNTVTNFIFSSTTKTPNKYLVYNTSENDLKNFLSLSSYSINWGDGYEQIITNFVPKFNEHTYSAPGSYKISLKQKTPWGTNVVEKTVVVPFTKMTIDDPYGEAFFTPNIGSWSSTPISYNFIFSGDSNNLISDQTSDKYVTVPFSVSGYTKSRLSELKLYGPTQYQVGFIVKKNNVDFGQLVVVDPVVNGTQEFYTGYTIEGTSYIDFPNDITVYLFDSSGLTSNWMVQEPLTKNEELLNVIFDPEVQSDVFIERGKNSALERVQRLGEVDNIGDLENYGYGFFNFSQQ